MGESRATTRKRWAQPPIPNTNSLFTKAAPAAAGALRGFAAVRRRSSPHEVLGTTQYPKLHAGQTPGLLCGVKSPYWRDQYSSGALRVLDALVTRPIVKW